MDGKHTVHLAHPMLNTTQREDSDFQEGEGKFPITSNPHGKYWYGSQICPYSAVPSSPTHEQMHEAQNPEQPHDPSASPGTLQEMPGKFLVPPMQVPIPLAFTGRGPWELPAPPVFRLLNVGDSDPCLLDSQSSYKARGSEHGNFHAGEHLVPELSSTQTNFFIILRTNTSSSPSCANQFKTPDFAKRKLISEHLCGSVG